MERGRLLGEGLLRWIQRRRGVVGSGGATRRAGGGIGGGDGRSAPRAMGRRDVLRGEQGGRHGFDRGESPAMLHHELIDLVDGAFGIVGELGIRCISREWLLLLLLLLRLRKCRRCRSAK